MMYHPEPEPWPEILITGPLVSTTLFGRDFSW